MDFKEMFLDMKNEIILSTTKDKFKVKLYEINNSFFTFRIYVGDKWITEAYYDRESTSLKIIYHTPDIDWEKDSFEVTFKKNKEFSEASKKYFPTWNSLIEEYIDKNPKEFKKFN